MDILHFLYQTTAGRVLLKPLVCRPVSRFCGKLLDTRASKIIIKPFQRRYGIETEEYDLSDIHSFNDFFCRPLKSGKRKISSDPHTLIAPCDALLTAVPIREGSIFPVKQSLFELEQLLRFEKLAAEFKGGVCLIFRLWVNHYHRYCYVDSGKKEHDVFIPGVLHTVQPVALQNRPVFVENCRSITVLDSKSFGRMIQAEVGAMLVGRIVNNHPEAGSVKRGEEKGHFAYGGSTILVLLKKDTAVLREDILRASKNGTEIPVKMGEGIGKINQTDQ